VNDPAPLASFAASRVRGRALPYGRSRDAKGDVGRLGTRCAPHQVSRPAVARLLPRGAWAMPLVVPLALGCTSATRCKARLSVAEPDDLPRVAPRSAAGLFRRSHPDTRTWVVLARGRGYVALVNELERLTVAVGVEPPCSTRGASLRRSPMTNADPVKPHGVTGPVPVAPVAHVPAPRARTKCRKPY